MLLSPLFPVELFTISAQYSKKTKKQTKKRANGSTWLDKYIHHKRETDFWPRERSSTQSSDSSITTIWLIAVFSSTMHVVISFCPFPSLSLHLNSLYMARTRPKYVTIITFTLITVLYVSFCQYRRGQCDYWGHMITSIGNIILQGLADQLMLQWSVITTGYLVIWIGFLTFSKVISTFKNLLCILYWPHLISSDDVISTRGLSRP